MNDVPVSIRSAHRALADGVGFVLLAAATVLAASAAAMLADLRHIPLPLFPGVGLALAGLALSGRKFWPAVLLGLLPAMLIRTPGHVSAVNLLACLAEVAMSWFGAGLLERDDAGLLRAPDALHLLGVGGSIVIVCVLGAILDPMLQRGSFEVPAILRNVMIAAPVETFLAIGLLVWPAGATAQRRALRAAVVLLAGVIFVLSDAGLSAAGILPTRYAAFVCMIVTAALLVNAVGVTRLGARALAAKRGDVRMTAFVADAPIAIAALDRELRYIAVSRRYLEDLRIADAAKVIGRTPAEVAAAYAEHLGDAPARVLAGEKVSRPVAKVAMADGVSEYFRSELQPWHDADGGIGGVMVFGEIASEAVSSRAALEEAELRYRSVFEQAAAGFARCAQDGRYLEVNDRFCAIAGHDRAALLTKTYRDITHPLDLAASDAMMEAMTAYQDKSFTIEKRYVARDGAIVWVALSTTMIRDREGRALYTAQAVQDITARKDAQAALAKSEMRLRLAQSAAGAGLWEIDFDRDAIIASPDMLRMHGLPPDRTDGVPLPEWRALFDRATLDLVDATGFATRDLTNHDLVYPVDLPDHGQRWIHSIGRTYRTTDNSKRLIGLAIDVTAAQTAQAELKQAQAAMLHISHLSAMGSVAATLAHELNQPLAAIVNYIELCAQILKVDRETDSARLLDAVNQAQTQAMRAGQLLQKMRSLTTNTASPRHCQPVNEIVENACTMIAHDAASENVVIRRDYQQGDSVIVADRLQIEQVLLGIFYNAIEALHDSDDKRIEVCVSRRGEMVVIRVADSGPGAPEAALKRLFEPFAESRGRGSGLALPVCRTIIESHDGKLTVEVAREGGAAFLIALPVALPVTAPRQPAFR